MTRPFRLGKKNKKSLRFFNRHASGYSLPEVMVASVVLAASVAMAANLSNSTMDGMQSMNLRSKLDSALAARMELIRDAGFRYLCTQGCDNDQLSLQLKYDLDTLTPLCKADSLGSSLNSYLAAEHPELTKTFNLNSVDAKAPSILITPTITASGNRLSVTLTAEDSSDQAIQSISSTIVPHAQGWCP
jgi:prepilin-type N-terminal cleavage/methylation domain-containing protein